MTPLETAIVAFEQARFERARANAVYGACIDQLRPLLPVQPEHTALDCEGHAFRVKRIAFEHDTSGAPGWLISGPAIRADGTAGTMRRSRWLNVDGSTGAA